MSQSDRRRYKFFSLRGGDRRSCRASFSLAGEDVCSARLYEKVKGKLLTKDKARPRGEGGNTISRAREEGTSISEAVVVGRQRRVG